MEYPWQAYICYNTPDDATSIGDIHSCALGTQSILPQTRRRRRRREERSRNDPVFGRIRIVPVAA